MRLWHIDLVKYLPKGQLLAQWRELNSIFKKQDKHILINYVYDYDKQYLHDYTCVVMQEMQDRGYKIRSTENYVNYFTKDGITGNTSLRFKEHDDEYLAVCYYNLKEKYQRGQKDFTPDVWQKLDDYYLSRTEQWVEEPLEDQVSPPEEDYIPLNHERCDRCMYLDNCAFRYICTNKASYNCGKTVKPNDGCSSWRGVQWK